MPGIFISYRRQDAGPWAGRIYDWLINQWGREHVFMDIDTIAPGEDFRVAISKTLTECDVALVVIGPRWLTVVDDTGARRLDDAGDVHRTEVVSALNRDDVLVIPVLVGDATMPRFSDLPEPMRALVYRNAAIIDDRRFGADMHALNESLEQLAERLAAERAKSEPAFVGREGGPGPDAADQADRAHEDEADQADQAYHGEEAGRARGGAAEAERRRRRRALGWAAAAVAVLVAVVVATVVLARGGDADLVVSGTAPWTDTGIDLAVGDRLVVAASGTVRHNQADERAAVGPGGAAPGEVDPALNTPGVGVYVFPPGHGGLVGRIGEDGAVFAVGRRLVVDRVPSAGRLWLGINDFDHGNVERAVSNNSGSFEIKISVTRR